MRLRIAVKMRHKDFIEFDSIETLHLNIKCLMWIFLLFEIYFANLLLLLKKLIKYLRIVNAA